MRDIPVRQNIADWINMYAIQVNVQDYRIIIPMPRRVLCLHQFRYRFRDDASSAYEYLFYEARDQVAVLNDQ